MGRTSYDQLISSGWEWPYQGKKCYVFTNREHGFDNRVEFISGNISEFMSNLKSQPGSNIWLLGGAELANSFMKERLIDKFSIAIIPIILGKGISLFMSGIPTTKLILKEKEQFKNIVILHYEKK